MRHLVRTPKPDILCRKEKEWTEKFIESGKPRPDNSKYGHKDILLELNSISHNKCFYCEQSLKGVPKEIDHHIEISEKPDLAFNWDNLYLSCTECNNKKPNTEIPVSEVLNPFIHTDEEIEKHLTFQDEFITAKNNSKLGFKTIIKYRLNSENLDRIRSKKLREFERLLIIIQTNQIKESGRNMNEKEKASLLFFLQPDQSFSLMFRLLLKERNL